MTPLLWAKGSGHDKSGKASIERLYNCFLEPNPEQSETPFKILGVPGTKFWQSFGAGPIRGILFHPDLNKLFLVSGNMLYVVDSASVGVPLGAIAGGGPVSMCANATQVMICANLGSYCATNATLVAIDGNYYSSCTYQDGYGICTLFGTNQFYITAIDDFSTIAALDFTSADAYTGKALAGISCNEQLVIFGQTSIIPYYNSGNAAFPFAKMGGGTIQVGTLGQSPTLLQDAIGWVADDYSVQIWAGNQHKIVSTSGIESWIEERLQPNAVRGLRYRQEGHDFFVLSWPDGSIAYDTMTGLWHDRGSWGKPRWAPDCVTRAWGMTLVGDANNGDVCELDSATYCEQHLGSYGGAGAVTPLLRTIQPAPIHGGGNRVIMSEVRLNADSGVGLDGSGDGSDPRWALDWSDDTGKTWSNQLYRSAGKVGEYRDVARWHRLGQFRDRTLRFSLTAPVSMSVLGAFARMDACNG